MSSIIVLTGRRRVGKTELIKKFLEAKTGVYFFVNSEKSEKMLIAEFSAYLRGIEMLERPLHGLHRE